MRIVGGIVQAIAKTSHPNQHRFSFNHWVKSDPKQEESELRGIVVNWIPDPLGYEEELELSLLLTLALINSLHFLK